MILNIFSYLRRSFKDGRYYTVSKKDTNRFHKEAAKRSDKEHLRDGKIFLCTGRVTLSEMIWIGFELKIKEIM